MLCCAFIDPFFSVTYGKATSSLLSMDFSSLNYIAIIVAALAAFFIGFMWHGPVFGKTWVKLMKITPAEMEKGMKEMQGKMQYYMAGAFVQQLVICTAIALFVKALGATTVMSAVEVGFWIWLIIAGVLLNGVLWEKKSVPLYAFNSAYQFVSIVVAALIVGLWQ